MRKNPNNPSINVYEVEVILLVFQIWVEKWADQRLRVSTDSTTVHLGLFEFTLNGLPNTPLREIWLLAAKWDIVIEAHWIKKKKNRLADVLSYFDK